MSRLRRAAFALACAAYLAPAFAQGTAGGFPQRTMRIIVGFPPGSSNDTLARFIASRLNERLGQSVVVDNRPGASGVIGNEIAARANPDGHTLLLMTTTYTMTPAVRKVPYDSLRAFAPVALLGVGPLVLVASPGQPFDSVKALIEAARTRPGILTYASAGSGGVNHFAAESFARSAGIQMSHVPYKGGAPALVDVIAGQVNVMFGTLPLTLPQVRAGKVKALGVSSPARSRHLPQVPTIAEAGAPGYQLENWWGLAAPGGVPPGIVERLNAEVASILAEPDALRRMEADGAEPKPVSSAEFTRLVHTELARWAKVAREANITLD